MHITLARVASCPTVACYCHEQDEGHAEEMTHVMRMPTLRPAYVWPQRNAKVAEALAALAQIDFVEFSQTKTTNGTQFFVLSVYLKRQPSRIPTNRNSRAGSVALVDRALINPDYRLQKTLNDVHMLRYHAWVYTQHQNAKESPCEYCTAFRALTKTQYSRATLLAILWPSSARRRKVLEGFVNAMVALSIHGLANLQRGYRCQGFANIPSRIHRFLRP